MICRFHEFELDDQRYQLRCGGSPVRVELCALEVLSCLIRAGDTNQDGYGNICDPDFDNNGGVGISDHVILLPQWGKTVGDPGFDPEVDLDGDDAIGQKDDDILMLHWGGAPGPSGLSCAGTIPCP
jgi:hypothetical protein